MKNKPFIFWMIAPASICTLLISIYPIFQGISLSFTNYNILNYRNVRFTGFENFVNIFGNDLHFWEVIGFTFVYTIGTVIFSYLLGMAMALLMNEDVFGKPIFRVLLLLPWIIPSVVAANSWLWILNDETGIVNRALMHIGLIGKPIQFLSTSYMAKLTVMMVSVWKNFPFMMLVLLAGLQNISSDLMESACIDGANKWKSFIYIKLPMLKQVSVTALVLMTIWTFNNFENIYIMTRGGPAQSTEVMSIYSYNVAFFRNKLGYASAISVVMMLFMIVMSIIYMRTLKNNQD